MKCDIEGCEREGKIIKLGGRICLVHYKRFLKHGSFENRQEIFNERGRITRATKCKYCDKLIGYQGKRGMCSKHYAMWRIHGDPLHFDNRPKKCNSHGYYRKGQKGEHRKVYEDFHGIKLTKEQQIHHIDFNKINNSIENLWLYNSNSEHIKVHRAYEKLLKQYPVEDIIFSNGKYVYKGDLEE